MPLNIPAALLPDGAARTARLPLHRIACRRSKRALRNHENASLLRLSVLQ